jgi:CysZ protein
VKEVFLGIALLLRTPRLWPLALAPLMGAFLFYVVLGVAGWFWLMPLLKEGFGEGAIFGTIAALLAWLLLFPYLFLVFASAITSIAFEPLAREVERCVTNKTPSPIPLTTGQSLRDSGHRFLVNMTLGGMAFLIGLPLSPFEPLGLVPGVLAASLIGLLDYTSVGYLRRGRTLTAQWRHLRTRLDVDVLGFALVAGLLSLMPFVGLFLMPGLIAGGTLLALKKQEENT